MEDFYQILGIPRNADSKTVKQAYRKLAMKYHPDRNKEVGAEEQFKKITNAYAILGDDHKKAAYDNGENLDPSAPPGRGPFSRTDNGFYNFHGGDIHDLFVDLFGPAAFRKSQPHVYQNQHINLNYQLSLEEAYFGKDTEVSFSTKSKLNQKFKLSIPPGIEHGMRIRFPGRGDDSLKGVPAGDLFVTVGIIPHERFKRIDQLTLLTTQSLTYIDAMLGCTCEFKTIDGSQIAMEVSPGIGPDAILKVAGKGMKDNYGVRGDLLVEIKLFSPKLNREQRSVLTKIQNELKLNS